MVTERLATESAAPQSSVDQVREQFLKEELDKTAGTPEATEETPAEQQQAKADQPETEGEETEETEEEAQAVELPENWDQHEEVIERLRVARDEGYNQAKSHLTRAHSATLAEMEEAHAGELEQATQRAVANQVVSSFAEAIADLDLRDPGEARQVARLLQQNSNWAGVLMGFQERDGQARLANAITADERWVKEITGEDADEFNATVRELALKLRASAGRAKSSDEITKAYASAVGSYLEERDKMRDKVIIAQAIQAEKERLEGLAKKAAGLSDRADKRSTQGAPVRPQGRGATAGSRTDAEILADPTTPISELEKIRARQQAGQ